jgi:hypothetical protein
MKRLGVQTLMAVVAMLSASNAFAGGYGSLGSAWYVNTYSHQMSFQAPYSDVKNNTVLFISDTVWYDNLAVCQNNSGKVTFVPGGGQSDPFQIVNPGALQTVADQTADCQKQGTNNICTDTVSYFSKLSEIETAYQQNHIPAGCLISDTPYQCFLKLLGLDPNLVFQCQNQNGSLVQIVTKGVCAIVTARKCDTQGCTDETFKGYRFTYPSFNQPETTPPISFTATPDDNCVTCVNNPTAANCAPH